MDDSKRNPGWERPADWPYEEDWGSAVWKERMKKSNENLSRLRKEVGFLTCPSCQQEHTALTLTCRRCEFNVNISEGSNE